MASMEAARAPLLIEFREREGSGRRVPRFAGRLAKAACKWLRRLAEPSVAWSGEPVWRLFPFVLALAFAVRAAVALFGDFLLHPDEVIQYLEPAHRAAFGNGIGYWEQFPGARPWLLPGFIAGLLTGFAAIGWDQPAWYVPAIKLVFCLISLGIPAGMYFFARRSFGEASVRVALLAVLAAAIRVQYAPAALAMLGWLCLRLGGASCKLAWARTHLLLATCGSVLLPLAASVASVRRYALPIALMLLTLAIHSLIPHKEYRFITLAIPCLLMVAADAVVRLAQSRPLREFFTRLRIGA